MKKFKKAYKKDYSKPTFKQVKKIVKKEIANEVETKLLTQNTSTTFNSIGTSWVELECTGLSQGDTQGTRDGNQITLKGLRLTGVLVGGQSNLATDDNRNFVRIVVALWDSKSATPLQTNGCTSSALLSDKVATGTGLIKKYYDKIHLLPVAGRDSTGYIPSMKYIKKFFKFNRKINYQSTVAGSAQNKLIISMISDSGAVSNPGFVQGDITTYFDDA